MAGTDRVFRAYGREAPEALVELTRRFAPGLVPAGARVTPMDVDDSRLEPPSPLRDADWIARVDPGVLLHVECQGYRDRTFLDRVFDYHLRLVARYPGRRVHTIALWVIDPPARQRASTIERKGVRISFTSLVLSELPAASLLRSPRTACFAAGADTGRWTAAELCRRVARVLARHEASYHAWQMALATGMTRKRGEAMMKAMKRAGADTLVYNELVKWGEDRGLEKGLKKGRKEGRAEGLAEGQVEGLRKGIATAYAARFGKALPTKLREAVAAAQDAEELNRWLAIACAGSAADLREAVLGRTPARRAAHP